MVDRERFKGDDTLGAYSGELNCTSLDISYVDIVEGKDVPGRPNMVSMVWQVEASWNDCKKTLNLTHPSYMINTTDGSLHSIESSSGA